MGTGGASVGGGYRLEISADGSESRLFRPDGTVAVITDANGTRHMGDVLPCTGCKFLVRVDNNAVCKADDPEWRSVWNPLSERYELRTDYVGRVSKRDRGTVFRPSVAEMRAPGAICGPDRKLYQPNWRRRFWTWITRRTREQAAHLKREYSRCR